MKKILILLFIAVFFVSVGQKREKRSVGSFTNILFQAPGKLYLKQGNANTLELEGAKEVLEKIETDIEGNKLIIRHQDQNHWFNWRNWDDNDQITVYITIKDIEEIMVIGSSDIIAETKLKAGNLDLKVSGSGSISVEIEAGDVDADVSGSGSLNIKGKLKSLDSDITGSGKVVLEGIISERIINSISGSGRFEVSGTAGEIKTNITGSGKVLGANLEVNRCDVKISGSGDVEINVKSDLDVDISGSGSVYYKGNPAHVNSSSSGSGKVRKM